MLAKARLEVLILPDRAPHEVYALGLGACEEQDPAADHPVAEQGRGVVQEDEIEPVARHAAAERACEAPDRVLARCRGRRMFRIEQDRDVDVALVSCGLPSPASVQPGEAHRGIGGQGAGEAVAKAGKAPLLSRLDHPSAPPPPAAPAQPRTRSGSQVAIPGTAIATSMNATMA